MVGDREISLLYTIYTNGGLLIWRYIEDHAHLDYMPVLAKRFYTLARKGLIVIKADGKRKGKVAYISDKGMQLLKALGLIQ